MNMLIAYFSYTGHTKGIAQQVRNITGSTLFEICPATPYSSDYDTTERRGRKETRDSYQPPLAEQTDLSAYDAILLGTPAQLVQHSCASSGHFPGGERFFR